MAHKAVGRPASEIDAALFDDLREFRKRPGEPSPERMDGLFDLTETLGQGNAERAFEELERLYQQYGFDPETSIGAYFYLSGWNVGLDTVDERRHRYADRHGCVIETALRRAERGLRELLALIRDRSEASRPWAVVSLFQSGTSFQPFLDFNLGHEPWRAPVIQLNGEQLTDIDFHVHHAQESGLSYTSRIVLPEYPLSLDVKFGEPMARLRVIWEMPVWPVWQVLSWTADPRILTRLRTFRQRAVEVSVEWWDQTAPGMGELDRRSWKT